MQKTESIILLSLLVLVTYLFAASVREFWPFVPVENVAITTPTPIPGSQSPTTPNELTFEEYELVRDDLFAVVSEFDPAVALRVLQNRMDSNDKVLRSCHPLVHDIGHAAYEKYQDFGTAASFQNDTCNSGYLHGVIESYFTGVADPAVTMKTVCVGAPDLGRCYHAVGHGLMFYSDNNLPQSIQLCDTYTSAYAKSQCTQGAYMENFNSDLKAHVSSYLKPDEPLYPCSQQPSQFRSGCYYYAPVYYLTLHRDDYQGALQACDAALPANKGDCIRGVGSRILKNNLRDIPFVEAQCNQAPEEFVSFCIDGVVGFYINQYNSVQKGRELCPTLQEQNQAACIAAIEARKYQFDM